MKNPEKPNKNDITYEHIQDLNELPRWKWVNSKLEEVDLRKINYHYLMQIYNFMDQHEDRIEYRTTKQYEYVRDRLGVLNRRHNKALEVLRSAIIKKMSEPPNP